MSDNQIDIEEITLRAVGMRAPRKNADGDIVEDAQVVITFQCSIDRAGMHLNQLGRLLKRDRVIKHLRLAFVEQLELPKVEPASDADERPRVSDPLGAITSNGHSAAHAKDAVTKTTRVGTGTKKRAAVTA